MSSKDLAVWDIISEPIMAYHEFLRDFEETIRAAADQIAFKTVDQSAPATLEYLIRDYLDHLKHHLDQIWRR